MEKKDKRAKKKDRSEEKEKPKPVDTNPEEEATEESSKQGLSTSRKSKKRKAPEKEKKSSEGSESSKKAKSEKPKPEKPKKKEREKKAPTSAAEKASSSKATTTTPEDTNMDRDSSGDSEGEGGFGGGDTNADVLQGLLRRLGASTGMSPDDLLSSMSMGMGGLSAAMRGGGSGGPLRSAIDRLGSADEGRQLAALHEVSDGLSLGNEDTLAGLRVDALMPHLVACLRKEHSPETMLMAARCVTHLVDALPTACMPVAHSGAVQLLCEKLLSVEYIDLAEQCMAAVERLAAEVPGPVIREGGMMAVLAFLDFYPLALQRTAVVAAGHMCHRFPKSQFTRLEDSIPNLTALLSNQDQRLMEGALQCFVRLAESFADDAQKTQALNAHGLATNLLRILGDSGQSGRAVSMALKVLAHLARSSPSAIGLALLNEGVVNPIRTILTQAGSGGRLGPEHVAEAVNLVCDLLPPLPAESSTGGAMMMMSDVSTTTSPSESVPSMYRDNPHLLIALSEAVFGPLLQLHGSMGPPAARQKCAAAMLRMLSYSSPEALFDLLKSLPVSTFVATLLRSRDPSTVSLALCMAETLLRQLPQVFRKYFVREGVLSEIAKLAASASVAESVRTPTATIPAATTRRRMHTAIDQEEEDEEDHEESEDEEGDGYTEEPMRSPPTATNTGSSPFSSFFRHIATSIQQRNGGSTSPTTTATAVDTATSGSVSPGLASLLSSVRAGIAASPPNGSGQQQQPRSPLSSGSAQQARRARDILIAHFSGANSPTAASPLSTQQQSQSQSQGLGGDSLLLLNESVMSGVELFETEAMVRLKTAAEYFERRAPLCVHEASPIDDVLAEEEDVLHQVCDALVSDEGVSAYEFANCGIAQALASYLTALPSSESKQQSVHQSQQQQKAERKEEDETMFELDVDTTTATATDSSKQQPAATAAVPANSSSSSKDLRAARTALVLRVLTTHPMATTSTSTVPDLSSGTSPQSFASGSMSMMDTMMLDSTAAKPANVLAVLARLVQNALNASDSFPVVLLTSSTSDQQQQGDRMSDMLSRLAGRSPSSSGASSGPLRLLSQPIRIRISKAEDQQQEGGGGGVPMSSTAMVEPLASMSAVEDFVASRLARLGGSISTGRSRRTAAAAAMNLPKVDLPSLHEHALVAATSGAQCGYSNSGVNCDTCGARDVLNRLGTVFHCPACGNWDACASCAAKAGWKAESTKQQQEERSQSPSGPSTQSQSQSQSQTQRVEAEGGMTMGDDEEGDGEFYPEDTQELPQQGEEGFMDHEGDGEEEEEEEVDLNMSAATELSPPRRTDQHSHSGKAPEQQPAASSTASTSRQQQQQQEDEGLHPLQAPRSSGVVLMVNGQDVPSHMSVFQALHKYANVVPGSGSGAAAAESIRHFWDRTHSVTYRLVSDGQSASQRAPNNSGRDTVASELSAAGATGSSNELDAPLLVTPFDAPSPLQQRQREEAQPMASTSEKAPASGAAGGGGGSVLTGSGDATAWMDVDAKTHGLLELLRVLHDANALSHTTMPDTYPAGTTAVPEAEFANAKISAKLARQATDVILTHAGCAPQWTRAVLRSYPFLASFHSRAQWFYLTGLGMGRALHKLSEEQAAAASSAGGGGGAGGASSEGTRAGRVPRQKVRLSRHRILESARKVLDTYGGQRALLEFEYFNEVGSGLGPTLEFYTLVSHELQLRSLHMWRTDAPLSATTTAAETEAPQPLPADATATGDTAVVTEEAESATGKQKELSEEHDDSKYVHAPHGLFPAPIRPRGTQPIPTNHQPTSRPGVSPLPGAGGVFTHGYEMDRDGSQPPQLPTHMIESPSPLGAPSENMFAGGAQGAGRLQQQCEGEDEKRRAEVIQNFGLLGKFLARAIMDRRLVDLRFSEAFLKLVTGRQLTFDDMRHVDPVLHRQLQDMLRLVQQKRDIERDPLLSEDAKKAAIEGITWNGTQISDLCLDMTLPGHPDIPLKPTSENEQPEEAVTIHSLEEYVWGVVRVTLDTGIREQVAAFRSGFNSVFPLSSIASFAPREIEEIACGSAEVFDTKLLQEHTKCDHGYTHSSRVVQLLFEVLVEMSPSQQHDFLRWATGSPKLPLGGLRSLRPKLTIVRKTPDSGRASDEYLPSVMTCANYLKLPDYSTKDVLRERLLYAVREGQASFHLS